MQSFCTKMVWKNSECPILAVPNFLQSFGKIVGKIWNTHFWQFQIYTSLFGKNLEHPFLWPFQISSNLFGKNCWKKFRTSIFGYSQFLEVFLKKFGVSIFGHSKFLQIYLGKIVGKKIGTSSFGHSKFLPVFLEKLLEII